MPRLVDRSGNASEGAAAWRKQSWRAAACFAIGLWALATFAVRPSVAQEATTAPTCTGCTPSKAAKPKSKPRKPERVSRARAPVTTGRVASEGSWRGASTGPCIPTWRWTIGIESGSISGDKTTGRVSSNGQARGAMIVFGTTYNFVGHFGATVGSGTWKSHECSGTWSAAKS
jgi:hypothetical protein